MQRLKTNYLKTRVIQLASELPFIMADMTQQPFETYNSPDNLKNPFAFEQALFLSCAVKKWKIDETQFTKVEKHYFDKGVEQLNKFNELHTLMSQISLLNKNLYYVYWKMTVDQTASNIASFNTDTEDVSIKQLEETIGAYNEADKALAEYPEWQSKMRMELGKYINLIYSLHVENPQMEKILGSFDRHQYFK